MACRYGKPAFAVEIKLCDPAEHSRPLARREKSTAGPFRRLFSHFLPLRPTINKQGGKVKCRFAKFLFYDNDLRALVEAGTKRFFVQK
jgi:hypothetical protein